MPFVSAEAVPKKILEIMNEPGLSRENVASHLQVNSTSVLVLHYSGFIRIHIV